MPGLIRPTATRLSDGRVALLGGLPMGEGDDTPVGFATVDATGNFRVLPGPRQPRWGHFAIACGPGSLLALSGEDFDDGLAWSDERLDALARDAEVFDFETGRWRDVAPVPGMASTAHR